MNCVCLCAGVSSIIYYIAVACIPIRMYALLSKTLYEMLIQSTFGYLKLWLDNTVRVSFADFVIFVLVICEIDMHLAK